MKASGKSHREGITQTQIVEMFPDEETAGKSFGSHFWSSGRFYLHCVIVASGEVPNATPMPY